MGDLEAQSTTRSEQSGTTRVILVLMLIFMAIATFLIFYTVKNDYETTQRLLALEGKLSMENEEQNDELPVMTQTIRSARDADGFPEDCTSHFYPNLTIKPSAHLVGSDSMGTDLNDIAENRIQCGWSCQAHGHVHGGMEAKNGSITVPVGGIYLVYSQIKIVHNSQHKALHYGHYTALKHPGFGPVKILQGLNTANTVDTKFTHSAHHQSGLFYIPRGGSIFVYVWRVGDLRPSRDITYDPASTYFGAYYVSGCAEEECGELNNYKR